MVARRTATRPKSSATKRDLRRLLRMVRQYGPDAAHEKVQLLERLAQAALTSAQEVSQLHEAACFLRAYPDSEEVLGGAVHILDGFAAREDLRRHRDTLAGTGIAGTDTHFAYFWFTTCLLAKRWPHLLTVDWDEFEHAEALEELLPFLLSEHESLLLEEMEHSGVQRSSAELVEALKGSSETDAAFLVDAFLGMPAGPLLREKLFDDLVLPLVLAAGTDTPSRTHAAFPVPRVTYRTEPLTRAASPSKRAFSEEPASVRLVTDDEGDELVWLARESMMTRKRDLYAFINADPRDVLLIEYGGGLQFACIGVTPARRGVLHAMYVILAMQNGVPVGYAQATTLFESAEVNFNVFDTFRAAEASRIFVATLAMMHHVFAAKTFAINTQQLGEDNPEALHTGAWWFYHKHGFRPDGAELRTLADHEVAQRRRDPSHRSSLETLRELGSEPLFLSLGRRRSDAVGRLDLPHLGASISRRVSDLLDCRRGQLVRRARAAALARLGVRDTAGWSHGERLAWSHWAPLLVALPGVESWSAAERRALVRVVRAKGGRREVEFVRLFDAHAPLRRAVLALARRRSAGVEQG